MARTGTGVSAAALAVDATAKPARNVLRSMSCMRPHHPNEEWAKGTQPQAGKTLITGAANRITNAGVLRRSPEPTRNVGDRLVTRLAVSLRLSREQGARSIRWDHEVTRS